MKPATQAFRDTLKQEHAVSVQPRLIAEWEYNRIFQPTITVSPSQTTADEDHVAAFGDVDSIALPNRPRTGNAKARVDSIVTPLGTYRDVPNQSRFYPAGYKDAYAYFGSVQTSGLVASNGAYNFDDPIVITSIYPSLIAVNKLVVGFEMSYARPVTISIEMSSDGNGWFEVAANPTPDDNGQIVIYYNGQDFWGDTEEYGAAVDIMGVRVTVSSMDTPYTHLDVIQVSPRLENDLTPFLVKYDVSMSVDSPSFIAPMGKASSNTATVTLSNVDGRFNNQNTSSIYYGMIDKKVQFKMDLGIDASGHGGLKYEYVREFTMWADAWGNQDQSTVDVSLKDSSVVLQERTMPPVFLENSSVGAIIWTVMDMIGLSNYAYSRAEDEGGQIVPYYWPSDTSETSNPRWGRLRVNTTLPPTSTIWQELSAMAESTQTAVYFDEYDIMQIKSRKSMYSSRPIDWNLDAVTNGTKLPDIVTTATDYNLTTNQVEITYKPCAFSNDQNGLPKMEQVWQPQPPVLNQVVPSDTQPTNDVVLRASSLVRDLVGIDDIWISPAEVVFWPFDSDVNIEGEVLHFTGKEYVYYDASGNRMTAVINSVEEQQQLDALNDQLHWKNAYSGRLPITARGLYGSYTDDHTIFTPGYTSLITSYNNQIFAPITGHVTQNAGYITQDNVPSTDWVTYHLRKHPTSVMPLTTNGTIWYGARIRFAGTPDATPGANWKLGGIWFAGDWGDAGYFLEITATSQIDGWEQRTWRHEIALVGMPGDAAAVGIPPTTGDPKGIQMPITADQWYDVDVSYTLRTDGHRLISVYIDGTFAGTFDVAPNYGPNISTMQGRFGTHVRGPSSMDVEYIYAVAQDDTTPFQTPDTTNFLDLKTGSYTSGFLQKNVRWNYRTINPGYRWPSGKVVSFPENINSGYLAFDEYGPVVHEMRTFVAAFDVSKVPVASSFPYLTNSAQAQILYYQSDAFGAEFMIANASRTNAVVNGQDDATAGPSNPIQQTLFVYGRSLYQAPNDVYVIKKDDAAIRKQGLIRTQFTSRYLQTDDMANEMGDWVLSLWSQGVDEVNATTFGNPLLQLGDLVTINFPVRGMTPATHQYFVVDIKNSFDAGYKTQLILRRCKL